MVTFVVTPAPDQPFVKENGLPISVPAPEPVSIVMSDGLCALMWRVKPNTVEFHAPRPICSCEKSHATCSSSNDARGNVCVRLMLA